MDGFEADDIIGTLAWRVEGVDVFMMTPDKDFGQLVRDRVYIYKPGRMGNPDEILGVPEILSRWEVERVDQVIDILGLWGDAVDNIPGVPGVGEKTAKKLIQEYGSLEGVLQNVDQLKGKMKEKFQEFSEQAIVSKRLATIDTQVPVEITLEDLARKEPNEELLSQVFQELEFRTLLKRVFPGSSNVNASQNSVESESSSPGKSKKKIEKREKIQAAHLLPAEARVAQSPTLLRCLVPQRQSRAFESRPLSRLRRCK
jgi:DNA polymerase-1